MARAKEVTSHQRTTASISPGQPVMGKRSFSPYDRIMEKAKVLMDLVSRLDTRRRSLGLSVKELAIRTELSRSNLASLLSGKRSPTPAVAEKLIGALDLDDSFADGLRSLMGSRYHSGFAQGPIKLTDHTA